MIYVIALTLFAMAGWAFGIATALAYAGCRSWSKHYRNRWDMTHRALEIVLVDELGRDWIEVGSFIERAEFEAVIEGEDFG